MKLRIKSNLLSILLISSAIALITGCDKDDAAPRDPVNTVTLNMLNEENGNTLLGTSDVYINKSNNFRAASSFIADVGRASGIGVRVEPQTGNLVKEAAVVPGYLYQIFNRNTIRDFPSGARATQIGAGYYHVYVVSAITSNDINTGAMVKYTLSYPNNRVLPEWDTNYGKLFNHGESVEIALPKGAEYDFEGHSSDDDDTFIVSATDGKLVITLNASPNNVSGPLGIYKTYIRSGNIFTRVIFTVGNY